LQAKIQDLHQQMQPFLATNKHNITALPCTCLCVPQAKIQDLHQQIEELTQKVGSLQTENAALHSRTSILEKVLDMRNEQIQVMQESKEVRAVDDAILCIT
jgi:predicted RNase H-like nuclease (RuvC/YqgF family)